MMLGLEIVGVSLVVISIIYAFIQKKTNVGLSLMIVLLILLLILGYL